jgi:hypothetical protein
MLYPQHHSVLLLLMPQVCAYPESICAQPPPFGMPIATHSNPLQYCGTL